MGSRPIPCLRHQPRRNGNLARHQSPATPQAKARARVPVPLVSLQVSKMSTDSTRERSTHVSEDDRQNQLRSPFEAYTSDSFRISTGSHCHATNTWLGGFTMRDLFLRIKYEVDRRPATSSAILVIVLISVVFILQGKEVFP